MRTPSVTMQREPMNAPSSTIDGARVDGLEHAADPDAAGQVDVRADLRARADRRPRVDHRPRADPGADVHVARHHHDARREERAVAGDRGRHDAHAQRRVVVLERDLVVVLERAELDRLHLAERGSSRGSPASPPRSRPSRRRRARRRAPRRGRARAIVASTRSASQTSPRGSRPRARTPRASGRARSGRSPRRSAPRNGPGETTMPCSSSRSANASELSPPGTSTQRYMVASLAATRQPFAREHGQEDARACAR